MVAFVLSDVRTPYRFESSEALVEWLLGRELIDDAEQVLMRAAREWLTDNHCPRAPNAAGRGAYLVPAELADRFRSECWPHIKRLSHS
jgi:hypothetical protein